ncbi:MAG: hypothetical protein IJ013_03855 [Bacteroidaceae bacterium]|nr:hypothetical protein [Bacteroidaceae bacterium]
MIKSLFRVVKCGEPFTVQSTKAEGGQVQKKYIHLQEIGGKFSDQYVATLLGKDAACNFYPGDVLAASLRASVSEYNEKMYQDILVVDFYKFNK